MNSLCKYEKKLIKKNNNSFLFAFLEKKCCGCNSIGNELVEGAISYILKHSKVYYSKTHLILAENVTLLSRNIIQLIPLGASTSKYKKSAFSMWLYMLYAGGMDVTSNKLHMRVIICVAFSSFKCDFSCDLRKALEFQPYWYKIRPDVTFILEHGG